MRLEKLYLIIVVLALLLAAPVSLVLHHKADLIKIEKQHNDTLRMEIKTKQEQLELKERQIQQEQLKQQDLQKQLQTKAATPVVVAAKPVKKAAPNTGGCETYRGLVSQYGWNVSIALAVMKAESGCNPNAISPTRDHGLMQLHNIAVYDPAENIRIAYVQKYLKGGWKHWAVCNRGIVSCF